MPVVATRVGGNAEILVDWLAEYLVPADDVDALAERIASLSAWKAEDPGLGSRCRDAVVVRLSLGQEVDAVDSASLPAGGSRELYSPRTLCDAMIAQWPARYRSGRLSDVDKGESRSTTQDPWD